MKTLARNILLCGAMCTGLLLMTPTMLSAKEIDLVCEMNHGHTWDVSLWSVSETVEETSEPCRVVWEVEENSIKSSRTCDMGELGGMMLFRTQKVDRRTGQYTSTSYVPSEVTFTGKCIPAEQAKERAF